MKLTWPVVYAALFVYRSVVAVIAFPVVTSFTTLGDARRYFGRATLAFSPGTFRDSTAMTDTLGAIFQTMSGGDPAIVALWFQTLGFVGIVRFLSALDTSQRLIGTLLVAFPSFTLWSSVPSKEAVVVFALGFVGAYLIKAYRGDYRFGPFELIAAYLLAIYKPQYYPAITLVLSSFLAHRFVRQKALAALIIAFLPLPFLYALRERFNDLSFEVQSHFIGTGRSTRAEFFVERYDVFGKLPEGFLLSFFGPTWSETGLSIVHRLAFFESFALVGLLLLVVISRNLSRLPVFSLIVTVSSSFWIMFGTFPFGVLNPGSAVRYRTGYLLLVFLIVLVIASRDRFQAGLRRGRDLRRTLEPQ